jgi:hypothetical protein
LAKGRNLVIGAESKQLISLWAVKTAVAITTAITDNPDIVPEVDRRTIRQEGRVPDGYWVGVFANPGDPLMAVDGSAAKEIDAGNAAPFRVTLAFRRFGFCVAERGGRVQDWEIPIQGKGPLRQTWPVPPNHFVWPD